MEKKLACTALAALACVAAPAAAPNTYGPVRTRMHNVVFHMGYGVTLHVNDLSGRLVSLSPDKPPAFDDIKGYRVDIDSARVAMDPESLSNLMNNYIFASPDAPLKNLKISIEGHELVQSGTLKRGIPIPFTMHGTIEATRDGQIRIHPTSLKAAGVIPKRVLDFLGLELDKLLKLKNTPAVRVEGDDLLLDPERLLPPPAIHGKLQQVSIENGMVVQRFDGGSKTAPIAPPDSRIRNYMYYRGNVLKFGKLTMEDTDLLLIDQNQKDPFDFSPEQYNDQLVAGYSKNTPSHGLMVWMPDLSALKKSPAQARAR